MSERAFWEEHHARRRMVYPAEEVLRFLAYAFPEEAARKEARALDLGAGSGRHAALMSRWGFRAYALDYAEQAARNIRTFLRLEGLAGQVACGALQPLPFRGESFDVVLPWECIFYGDRPFVAGVLAEIRRVLKPGGRCFTNLRSPADKHVDESELLSPGVYLNRGEWDGLVFAVFDEAEARALFAEGWELEWFDPYLISRRNGASRDAGWNILARKK